MHIPAIAVEFLGTFIFFFVIVSTGNGWIIGLTLALLIFVFGKISGGHFNPGVTIMMLYNKGVLFEDASLYLLVQVIAGILAVELWRRVLVNTSTAASPRF
jgi:glycerol uptake facilitator-like aquaporin